jgi:hypothetical protein
MPMRLPHLAIKRQSATLSLTPRHSVLLAGLLRSISLLRVSAAGPEIANYPATLCAIALALAEHGYRNERSVTFSPSSVRSMITA